MPVQVRPTVPYLPPPASFVPRGHFVPCPPPQSTPAPAKPPECARRGASLPAMRRLFVCQEVNRMGNPRYANGQLRRRNRARLRAMGGECGICHGRFGRFIMTNLPTHSIRYPSWWTRSSPFPAGGSSATVRAGSSGRLVEPSTRTLVLQCAKGQQNRSKRPEIGQIPARSEGFRRRLVRGGEGPAPALGDPCAVQRRFTHRKNFKGPEKGVSGHGDHEKHHGTGHPAGAAQTAG